MPETVSPEPVKMSEVALTMAALVIVVALSGVTFFLVSMVVELAFPEPSARVILINRGE